MTARPAIAAIAAACAFAGMTDARAGGSAQCPEQGFLQLGSLVYAETAVPAGVMLERSDDLGSGEVNRPRGTDPCQREQIETRVFAIVGVDPATAVLGEDGAGFILGGRCSGLPEDDRWSCVLQPLDFQDSRYTALAYPVGDDPRGEVELGEAIGQGTLGGEDVTVREIRGVDPAAAVGVEGRPSEAFVAPGVCPYERFSSEPQQDDLLTCLTAPMWFVFDPLGAGPGEEIQLIGDRVAIPELDGASVGLARLPGSFDTLPDPPGELIPVGAIGIDAAGRTSLAITVPDLPLGLYEAVVTCNACAAAFAGRTTFAAGSVAVLDEGGSEGGSSSATIVYIVVFALLFLAIIGGIVLWIRGVRPKFRRRNPL